MSNLQFDAQAMQAQQARRCPAVSIAGKVGHGLLPGKPQLPWLDECIAAEAERQPPQITAPAYAIRVAMDRAGMMIDRNGLFTVRRQPRGRIKARQSGQ